MAWVGRGAVVVAISQALGGCGREAPPVQPADYGTLEASPRCDTTAPPAPSTEDLHATPGGARFKVRVPANYDPRRAHPLLVVFAPAGFSAAATESHAALTDAATRAGFIVAFAAHRPLSPAWVRVQGEIPAAVARHWCIDPRRIVLAGHSDGGTVAHAAAFLQAVGPAPAAIVASAAGIRGDDLHAQPCPPPTSVLVLHSRDDTHFPPPAFGVSMAQWWARCNRCDAQSVTAVADWDRCVEYSRCSAGARTVHCETRGGHATWNVSPRLLLEFAAAARRD